MYVPWGEDKVVNAQSPEYDQGPIQPVPPENEFDSKSSKDIVSAKTTEASSNINIGISINLVFIILPR
jgi:hypothetical protein